MLDAPTVMASEPLAAAIIRRRAGARMKAAIFVEPGRIGLDEKPPVTHRFRLDEIEAAHELFAHQRGGVMKVAIAG